MTSFFILDADKAGTIQWCKDNFGPYDKSLNWNWFPFMVTDGKPATRFDIRDDGMSCLFKLRWGHVIKESNNDSR